MAQVARQVQWCRCRRRATSSSGGTLGGDARGIRRQRPRAGTGDAPAEFLLTSMDCSVDMFITCSHTHRMSKMIQLRHVPDALHRKLRLRAIEANMTLSEFLIREVAAVAERPSIDDLLARIRSRSGADLAESPAEAVRAERESRR